MQLLVSVRSAAEVAPALSGGADIIDAKEPSNGSLGPVSTAVLTEIMEQVPASVPMSIALGDLSTCQEVASAIDCIPARVNTASYYLKMGFAGVSSPHRVRALLHEGCRAASRHQTTFQIVAVAYADANQDETVAPERLFRIAADSGASAVLLDTQGKNSGNLLDRLPLEALTSLVAGMQRAGLSVALAGSLRAEDLALLAKAAPDIVGLRGAACAGGRGGMVSRGRVERLRHAIDDLNSASLRSSPSTVLLGETPDDRANPSWRR